MSSKHLSYWRCQFGGWGLAALSNFLLQIKRPGHHLDQELIANLSMILVGIAATHLLRAFYHRYGLLQRSLWAILLPCLALSAVATVIMVASLLGLLYVFNVFEQADILQPDNILANLVGLFPLVLVWNTLYLGIHSLLRWRQSELDKAALITALKDAQINALMGQLNPHFIFNALNNIRALMLEDVERARDSISLLARVLRQGLAAPKNSLISLRQELQVVDDFIQLSKLQLEQRLDWRLQISPELERQSDDIQIPPLLLQMLVENAIKHGISEVPGGGILALSIQRQGTMMQIELENPGTYHAQRPVNDSTGIGLKNIRERLRLQYQNTASFKIHARDGKVQAQLLLPLDS